LRTQAPPPGERAQPAAAPALEETGARDQKVAKVVGNEVHFECFTCGQAIATDLGAGGQELRCPECGEHLVVPQVPLSQSVDAPKRVGDEVHFACSTCSQPIAVHASAAGEEVRCPECGEHLVIPSA
jgi:DNA-directed RNA polymerase subunit RPC12/RpoP